jgi:hypothetical protein
LDLLWMLIAATAWAWGINCLLDYLRRRKMARWARQARLFYSPVDLLGLAPRVARLLKFPGAANVQVTDLMYRSDGQFHHCLFTVFYTRGVMSHRSQVMQVAALEDPINRRGMHNEPVLRTAPAGLRKMEQYQALLAQMPAEKADD